MESRLIDLSKYRLNRAREDLKTSRIDFDNHQFAASMNRSYYAVFHAIRAVNSLDGFDSRKHAGVIAYFNQYFLKTGKISNSRKMSEIIKDARRFREKSDYEDFFIAARDDAEEQLQNANLFVETISSFENADVVFITDGNCALPEGFLEQLRTAQEENGFFVTGVLLDAGSPGWEFSLKSFCQKIYRTSELMGEEVVRSLVCDRV